MGDPTVHACIARARTPLPEGHHPGLYPPLLTPAGGAGWREKGRLGFGGERGEEEGKVYQLEREGERKSKGRGEGNLKYCWREKGKRRRKGK